MNKLKLTCVVGARPNFMKMAAILHEIQQRPNVSATLIHTGQHFTPEMSQTLFHDLEMPEPDHNLEISTGSITEQTAEIMKAMERQLLAQRPDVLVVVGDVTSTLAAALAAVRMGVRIAHVEAGLRSFDRGMPEEINRILTDALSDYLFVTEPSAEINLRREGTPEEKIFFVGNVMIDTLLRFREKASASTIIERLELTPFQYGLVTLHRPSNVDDPEQLSRIIQVLDDLGDRMPLVFPAHPRTRQRLGSAGIAPRNLRLIPPQSYLDFLHLMSRARLVLTDSGGIQEETTILQVPCVTLRENTERPVTVFQGTNRLAGVDPSSIHRIALDALDEPKPTNRVPDLWDGAAARRILDVLEQSMRA